MRAIFISYRREDAEGQAGRLFDDLVMHFGEDSVFMDVAGLEPGRDFRRAIDEQVASCGVLLAVIGKSWFDAKDESGRRRLDDPMDFVRLETASALKRDIPVIPVLVRGANVPRAEQLPPDLAELAYRNAVELTHARWDSDLQVLVKALRPHVELLQKDVGSAKTEPAVSVSGKAWTAGTVGPSGEPGVGGTAPVATTAGFLPTMLRYLPRALASVPLKWSATAYYLLWWLGLAFTMMGLGFGVRLLPAIGLLTAALCLVCAADRIRHNTLVGMGWLGVVASIGAIALARSAPGVVTELCYLVGAIPFTVSLNLRKTWHQEV
jgi:hypothetical protein